jgi:hypothetical protein
MKYECKKCGVTGHVPEYLTIRQVFKHVNKDHTRQSPGCKAKINVSVGIEVDVNHIIKEKFNEEEVE